MPWQEPRTLEELSLAQQTALALDAALVRVARGCGAIELAVGRTLDTGGSGRATRCRSRTSATTRSGGRGRPAAPAPEAPSYSFRIIFTMSRGVPSGSTP